MKARDEIKLETLKLLSCALSYKKIEKQRELTNEEELAVVCSEAKKRKEAIEVYQKAGANKRAEREKKELEVLQEYLPPEISEEKLNLLVEEAIETVKPSGMADMGRVIAFVKAHNSTAEGGRIAAIAREKI